MDPDGFSGWFYKCAWNIIGEDFIKSIQCCWSKGFIPTGMNSNFLMLLPKVKNVKRANQYGPTGLMNFRFKVITKVITSRLSLIMDKLISHQQGAFIKERNIQEHIVLASEMVNELDIKRRGGNFGLKLDITQAYDSLKWEFLFQDMKAFGFSVNFVKWIHILLKSAKISVSINGGPAGYFGVSRGLRQGDTLSPLLFVIAEDVLSRQLISMVLNKTLTPMVNRNRVQPTHIFFTDDIFIFCNCDKINVRRLMQKLNEYQRSSGQNISLTKSKCFIGGESENRKLHVDAECNISLVSFPDKYLGVTLVPGSIKYTHVWECVEYLQDKLAGWKGQLLSFQERLILVKFVLSSIPIYNMSVYKWPARVLKECGLDIRKLEVINKALLMKLYWKILNGEEEWEKLFQAKFKNIRGEWITYYKKSSIWPSIKMIINEVEHNTRWLVSDGQQISVWQDTWIKDRPLCEIFPGNLLMQTNPNMKVAELLTNGEWIVPPEFSQFFGANELLVADNTSDRRIWCGSSTVRSGEERDEEQGYNEVESGGDKTNSGAQLVVFD
ncbi:uncharacterized protein LOC113360520 [Papaver somniferum]|uniref:uncharacterized protein LOC113360520 n=1 Tax=Papaver somniferum TaxID=3469 RepID=UPI000E6F7AAD|nr:uncharacterized protein LOC113360520 [Papaver somniferum]